ncbi:traB domain-containing protein isoform X2 [Macrosteles quadrilineatus]|uniref:traB domain-containing protein isoform X2 n=1 Tax=Macrosteles quadrilineatus TaxID=74068 RepID=UPI0023E0D88E|nr:traB domain-containing protein isoform X2 [Macrosteles quadrilineatus]
MGTGTEDEGTVPVLAMSSPVKTTSPTSTMDASSLDNSHVRSDSEEYESDDSIEITPKQPINQAPDPLIEENFDENLPSTVSLLTTPDGVKVYLVGTAHFSIESQDDVSKVIRNVRPHIVMVELCRSRASILQMDEETIEREAKNITFEKIMATVKENGVFHGLMYTLFLNLSAQLTKELGMAPGGEFRRALAEVRMLPNCVIHFGDRPIQVTLKRALSFLSWWQSIRLVWHLAFSKNPTTKEEVEKCKQKDLLDQMLKEMSGEFPELGRVFVEERDMYLTYSLQLATRHQPRRLTPTAVEQTRVVGIVGIGHMPGITKLWGTIKDADIPPIMTIPPPSRTGKVVKYTLKVCAVSLFVWGAYKLLAPRALSDAVNQVPRKARSIMKQVNSLLNQVEVYEASLIHR